MRLISGASVLAVSLVILGPEGGLQAGKPPKDIPVTIEFVDGSTASIQSDGGGAYRHGVAGVIAYISPGNSGALIFATSTVDTSGRMLQYYFGNCVADCTAFPFFSGNAVGTILAGPRSASGSSITNGFIGMTVNQELDVFAQMRVLGQADEWTLCMKPDVGSESICTLAQDQTYARVKRVQSNVWEMFAAESTPSGRRDVAGLLKTTGNGRRKTTSDEGAYSMPFRFTVTCVTATCS